MPSPDDLPLTWGQFPELISHVADQVAAVGPAAPSHLFVYRGERLSLVQEGPAWSTETAGMIANVTCRTIAAAEPDAVVIIGTCTVSSPSRFGGHGHRRRRAAMWVVVWADVDLLPHGPTGFVQPLNAPGQPAASPIPGLPHDKYVAAMLAVLEGGQVEDFPVDPDYADLPFALLAPPDSDQSHHDARMATS